MNAREISQLLSDRALDVAEYLLPGGKKRGPEWRAGSVGGESGGSLGVHLSGNKAGIWSDFASGEKGDLLDLWRLSRGCNLSQALQEAADYLGVKVDQTFRERRTYAKPNRPESARAPVGNVMRWLTETRKLSQDAIKAYRVAELGDYAVFPHLRDGELCNFKRRHYANKKDMRVEAGCEQMLFGWQAIDENAREVVICEGELDAMALWDYGFPALSVFSGAKNMAWVDNEYNALERFSTIYICFDNDEIGIEGRDKLVERLGIERCKVVTLPEKDANECLMLGRAKAEIDKAFAEARTMDPAELKSPTDFRGAILHRFFPANEEEPGTKLPWDKTHRIIRLRPSELSIWTGINGHGKSLLLSHVMLDAMKRGERVCIASFELKGDLMLHRMLRQLVGSKTAPHQEINRAIDWLHERLWVFDYLGTARGDRVLEVFSYARKRYGINHFVIDSLLKIGIAEDDYNGQKAFVERLCDFKNMHDCHVSLVAHSRKGEGENKAPGKMDVRGAGAITDLADSCFSVWRNKLKEEGKPTDVEWDAVLRCDKQRNGEWEGSVGLYFDRDSNQYLESEHDFAKRFDVSSFREEEVVDF